MGIGSWWRRAWGFHVRGKKKKGEVWRNNEDLWEALRPAQPGPRLGTGQQSAAVTEHWDPWLCCMKITFDKSSYTPGGKGEKKFLSIPLPTVSVFFLSQMKLQAFMALFLCSCWFWQKHELTRKSHSAYFLAFHAQDEQNTLGKQKEFTVVKVNILLIFVFKTHQKQRWGNLFV